MSELEPFRQQTRSWLEANAPQVLRGKLSDGEAWTNGGRNPRFKYQESRDWLDMMAERGWTVPTWPEDYGGGGLSREQGAVLSAEIRRLELPPPLVGFGLMMIGPTLLQYGTEDQKKEHISKIAKGQIRWC